MERKIKVEFTEMELNLLLAMIDTTLNVVEDDLDNPDRRDYVRLVIKLIQRMLNEISNKYDEE